MHPYFSLWAGRGDATGNSAMHHLLAQLAQPIHAAVRKLSGRPIHLRGIQPGRLPPNYLWQRLQDETNLEQAFQWLCGQTKEASDHHDVWDYRRQWESRKPELRQTLKLGEFTFQPVRIVEISNEQGDIERREIRCAEDRLVIRALSQVLQPVLQPRLSRHCTHLKGNGGLHQAVRDTQDHIAANPDHQVIKSDVKGYYAHIDHVILAEQLRELLPNEIRLHNLVWDSLRRTTEFGGEYRDIERGIPLGSSLSPLLGALYLAPLDDLAKTTGGFYRRYMDDWVWVLPKRHGLRKALKKQYAVLHALKVQMHPDKTFIGKVKKGFDFLGFHCRPTGMRVSDAALSRRDAKVARLYEPGADHKRIARYLARWLGWVGATIAYACHSQPCMPTTSYCGGSYNEITQYAINTTVCGLETNAPIYYWRKLDASIFPPTCTTNIYAGPKANPEFKGTHDYCQYPPPASLTDVAVAPSATYSFRNPTEDNEFFTCDTDESGWFIDTSIQIGVRNVVEVTASTNTGTEAGTTDITVTATTTYTVMGDQTVDLLVSGANITSGDYALSNTTITIPDGASEGSVTFTIQDDGLVEGDEVATLTLTNPSAGFNLGTTTSQNITITDNDYPSVTAITRVNTNPTNAASVDYSVTFSDPVDGVDSGDFTLTTNGITGAAVTSVSASSCNPSCTVTVNTGTGDGTLRLDLIDDNSINAFGQPLGGTLTNDGYFSTGQAYALDNIPPELSEVTPVPTPTNDSTPAYTFTSSEAGSIAYGGACASTTKDAVSGSNTLTFDALTDGSYSNCTITVTDSVGNPSAALNVNAFTIDTTQPSVTLEQAVGQADPATASPIRFTATFTEAVSGFTTGDVTLGGTAPGTLVGTVTGSGPYTIEVTGMTGAGTVIASIAAGKAQDSAGNGNLASTSADATVTIDNPVIQFSQASYPVAEDAGTTNAITLNRGGYSDFASSAVVTITGGSATGGGIDYTSSGFPLTVDFAPGETSIPVPVTISDDSRYEPAADETITFELGTPVNAVIGSAQGSTTLNITDNDAQPTVAFTTAAQSGAENGGVLTVTAALSNPSDQTVSVPFTLGGTAIGSGTDYSISTSPLTINAGDTTADITISPVVDDLYEGDEEVILTLGTPTNASASGTTVHTAILTSAEAMPTLDIDSPTLVEGDSATTPLNFTVSLSGPADEEVTVSYATADNSASSAGGDYDSNSGTVTFPANSTTAQTITVTINGDVTDEGVSEEFTVNLTSPSANAQIGEAQGTGTITDDDTAGILVTPTTGLITSEIGDTAQFTITLTSEPTAPVTLPLSSSDTSEGTVPAQVTLDSTNWNRGAVVKVTGVHDTLTDGNIAYSVITGAPLSDDPFYAGLTATDVADVVLTNLDKTIQMALSVSGDLNPVRAGSILNYTIKITNFGSVDAENYAVIESLPGDVNYTATSGDCLEGSAGVPTCTLGTIPAGTSKSYRVATQIGTLAVDPLVNNISGVDLNGDDSLVASASTSNELILDTDGDGIPDDLDSTPSVHNPNICSGAADANIGLMVVGPGVDAYCYATSSISTTAASTRNAVVMDGGALSLVTQSVHLKPGFEVQEGGSLRTILGNVANYLYVPSNLSAKSAERTRTPVIDPTLPILGTERDAQGLPVTNHHLGIDPSNRYITYLQEGADDRCSIVLIDLELGTNQQRSCPFMLTDGDLQPPLFNASEGGFEWSIIDTSGVMQTYVIQY